MSQRCVHKGCGQLFTDPESPCVYHPLPPEFHEGQKGWRCCKPRVLTFDEFLSIPPCTTGLHSVVDDTPQPEKKPQAPQEDVAPPPRLPQTPAPTVTQDIEKPAEPDGSQEPESDSPDIPIPSDAKCRRRGCQEAYKGEGSREGEACIFHPGAPLFHEGSKGYLCCKRRVLEFDEFLKIKGCTQKARHLFVGSGKSRPQAVEQDTLESVRHDFYQTSTTIHASLFLKKIIPPPKSSITFTPTHILLDLRTSDNKRFKDEMPLYGSIDPERSKFKVMGTKLELELTKADGRGWPVLKATDQQNGEIIQTGRAGTA